MVRFTIHLGIFAGGIVLLGSLVLACPGNAQEGEEIAQRNLGSMITIGQAIERFYQDWGVLLVDLKDGETPEGQARLHDVFEDVGNPADRPRTMRDVLAPLVHFGYLSEIPNDLYLPEGGNPQIDTFVYIDEDKAIPENDQVQPLDALSRVTTLIHGVDEWILLSPGAKGDYTTGSRRDFIIVTRMDAISQPPLLMEYMTLSWQNMRRIGEAIEQLRADTGVLLVDFWDDDTYEGRMRLHEVFHDAGDVNETVRGNLEVLLPLVELGYLDAIPLDPFKERILDSQVFTNNNYYFYLDNDAGIQGNDYGLYLLTLQDGEWALIGIRPGANSNPGVSYTSENSLVLLSSDLDSAASGWEIYP